MKTILETLDGGTLWLEKKGIVDARRNMQLMMSYQLDCSKIQLYTRFDEPLDENNLAPMRDMLKRRGEGVPLQHILGTVEFFRHEFKTDERALIPRPETEELVELVLKEIATKAKSGPIKILDMGCGSGVIGLSLAAELGSQAIVTCADTSDEALALARENAERLEIKNVTFCTTNLFSNINESFDLIVANLPYVPETDREHLAPELSHDPDLALFGGKDGLDIIKVFIHESKNHINNDAIIALEIGIHQSTQVEQLFTASGFHSISTHDDISGIPRFPIAHFAH